MKIEKKIRILESSLLFIAFLLFVVNLFFPELLPNNIKYIHSIANYIALALFITVFFLSSKITKK